ncbi:DUF1592 domain-containing protein [Botrimarina sp.]|uniref:DUF1592 domain-containing protein n=1 Tax=Botrimarina sp. TaxID=2795802 RepID=UPI0032EF4CBB
MRPETLRIWLLSIALAPAGVGAAAEGAPSGAELFAAQCADCHGEKGQGTDYYSSPLVGDLPVRELARVISDTMPEGDPAACVGPEAEAIARYAHQAFYSPIAQARNAPPRRELSRLTVRQYRQTLADLVAEFRGHGRWTDERGVKAHFRTKVNTGSVAEPRDLRLPRIDFRLTQLDELPDAFRDPNAEGKEEFGNTRIDVHVDINGSLLAPVTGDYEFIARTRNGVRVSVNDRELIDGSVRSDDEPELRGAATLVGGRVYRLRVSATRIREADLELALAWKPPGCVEELIPARYLSPRWSPAVHVTATPFPDDDRSVGYVRGAAISAGWDESATNAALEATDAILADLPQLAGVERGEELTADGARDFCRRLAERAFRRPLTDQEQQRLVDRHFADDSDQDPRPFTEAAELALLSTLKNPMFLYPEVALLGATPSERNAARLALYLWDGLPDQALREAAARGELADAAQLRRHAERMRDDLRARSKLDDFFRAWLKLDHVDNLSRDPEAFPDFNERVAADMLASLERLIEEVVWRGDGDLRTLFLTEDLYVNRRLAAFLGVEADFDVDDPAAHGDDFFVKAPRDTHLRAGVVTHPLLVTAFSYYSEPSPIHRGVFLARNVLGRRLKPPPEAVAPLAPELAPDLSVRERVTLQTSPGQCQACHVLINDLGFTLEHFDAVGRYRPTDLDKPVDSSGGYIATDGSEVRLDDARELAYFLAGSDDVHRSFVKQLFRHLTKQPIEAYGPETEARLLEGFRNSGFQIPWLLAEAATVAALAE